MTSEVITKYEEVSRSSGRTSELIKFLPRDGTKAFVFTHSWGAANDLSDRFDPYNTDVKFLVASSWEDIQHKMIGRNGKIYIDHYLLACINRNILDKLNEMYKPIEPKYSATVSDLTKEQLSSLCKSWNVTSSEEQKGGVSGNNK